MPPDEINNSRFAKPVVDGTVDSSHFPQAMLDAMTAEARVYVPVLGEQPKPPDITTQEPFTMQQARTLVLDALRGFDTKLAARAEEVFKAGYDDAATAAHNGAKFDWESSPDGSSRWRLEESKVGDVKTQRSITADTPLTEYGPANPNKFSVIDYQFDGRLNSVVYLAHELGHTLADDNLQKGGHLKYTDNPQHMAETQAYFVQHVIYKYLMTNPELEKDHPGINAAAEGHYKATMARAIQQFNEPSEGIHSRPMGLLAGLGFYNIAAGADDAARQSIIGDVLSANGGKGAGQILDDAGVTNLRAFAAQTVNSAVSPLVAADDDYGRTKTVVASKYVSGEVPAEPAVETPVIKPTTAARPKASALNL